MQIRVSNNNSDELFSYWNPGIEISLKKNSNIVLLILKYKTNIRISEVTDVENKSEEQ